MTAFIGRPSRAIESELEAKLREFPNSRGATIGRRIFARQVPAASEDTGARWHGLEDLYG
jgi:hypothetical protein